MTHICYWLAAVAAWLVGLSKTGLPGVSIPAIVLMAEAFPENARQSIGETLPLLLAGDVFAVLWFRRHADWGRLLRLLPYVLLGMLSGVWVLMKLQGNQLRPVIGVMVLAMFGLELGRHAFGWNRFPHRWWFAAISGFLAGFTTFVANAAMPVMTVYLISQDFDKEKFIGTSAWFFFILNLSKLPAYCMMSVLTPAMLPLNLWLAPVTWLGAVCGVFLLARIPQRAFNVLALALAGLAAFRLVLV
jgi:uncharacterized protein